MENFTITHNYGKSSLDNQDMALMPASLAKELLIMLEGQLRGATTSEIIGNQCDALRKCKTVEESVEVSIAYANKRMLISNIEKGNFDFYKIEKPSEAEIKATESLVEESIANKVLEVSPELQEV